MCWCSVSSLQINEQFAINLVAEEPVVVIQGRHTWCDGGWLAKMQTLCDGTVLFGDIDGRS